ncbi:MAG: serine/threonine protein kinase [Gemmatimonadales bacterium]
MSDTAGIRIADRYTVLRTLGQGAFGRTLLARDEEAGREVAIKVLDTSRVDTWKGFELFEREASVLRSVRHHGVPMIFDSFRAPWEDREAAFLAMEFVDGQSLAAIIEERRHLDPADVSHLLLELLGVLDYLHSRVPPILHRDIKPANIIVRPDGYPALVDFGAVRASIAAPGSDGSTIVGTYGYMPYEQHMGQASPASDLYALAATFLHLLTGTVPPDFMNAEGRIAVPESLPGGERLRQVLDRMLLPAPTARFQSAREVRQALMASGALPVATARNLPSVAGTRSVASPVDFSPAPRPLDGRAGERYRRLAPSLWRMKNADGSSTSGPLSVLLGLITFGIVPAILFAQASAQRRRLRHFFTEGTPAVAEITSIEQEKDEFGVRYGRVRFQFLADGGIHRGSDRVPVRVADRWRPGDEIEVLFLPDADYDALIISAR